MTDKGKWPFESQSQSVAGGEHDRELEKQHARLAAEVSHRQHARYDRFLVGGRAHQRKRGLS